MMDDDATQFSYFGDNELTQLDEISMNESSDEKDRALAEGTVFLNKYKILKVLGEGSFSLIYLLEANDASKKLLVAKEFFPKGFVTRNSLNEVILKTSLSEKEIENYQFMKDIFIGEAKNLVKVSSRTHPNVLSFFSLEENVNNTMYLITDYEEGITLKEYMRQRNKEYKGKLSNQEITLLLQGLLQGLEHIHNVKIYHQDIKLENILIRHDHTPLLLDFGASVILYDEKRKKYFNATTPRYASPEQIELAQPPAIDERSDIYALGVLAYKLVTDTFPPKASERLKALDEQHSDLYIPLETQKIYGYDMVVLRAIDKALNLLPETRFQNTKEFSKALLQKNIFNLEHSLKFLLWLVLPFVALLLYILWPTSQGTAKLNLNEKTYFVYSDGVKIAVSKEKTILLSTGTHELTFIKDGFIPFEINITVETNKITNVTAELIPSRHLIQLSSDIENAIFIVNNETIEKKSFQGQYDEKYIIKTIAPHHPSEIVKTDYTQLYHSQFRFYQKLKAKNQTVNLKINKPLDIGKTVIKVNDEIIKNNTFSAEDSEKYRIDIINPYFKPIHIERTYKDLVQTPLQIFTAEQGKGEVIIEKLLPDTMIEAYQKGDSMDIKINANVEYKNGTYIVNMAANDNIYFKLSKSGYKSEITSAFSLKHNERLDQIYVLTKIVNVQKVQKTIVKTPVTKVVSKLKPVKKVRKKAVKQKKKIKHKTKTSKKSSVYGGLTWYCVATSTGSDTYSAKRATRKKAYNGAMQSCRNKTKNGCHLSSCYLWSK